MESRLTALWSCRVVAWRWVGIEGIVYMLPAWSRPWQFLRLSDPSLWVYTWSSIHLTRGPDRVRAAESWFHILGKVCGRIWADEVVSRSVAVFCNSQIIVYDTSNRVLVCLNFLICFVILMNTLYVIVTRIHVSLLSSQIGVVLTWLHPYSTHPEKTKGKQNRINLGLLS